MQLQFQASWAWVAEGRQSLTPHTPRKSAAPSTKVSRGLAASQNGSTPGAREAPRADSERFLDVAEVLRDAPEDFIFEPEDDTEDELWEHEKRFSQTSAPGRGDTGQQPLEVKGALDPSQADILSAYSSEQGFQEVTVDALSKALRDGSAPVVLDVRTAEEYARGHIHGSRNVNLDRLSAAVRAGEIADAPTAVVCARGGRSAQACVRLSKVFGFADVRNVSGGMAAWEAAGLPMD